MNKFKLCSNAMLMVGGETISAFDDDTIESITAGQLYPVILTSMFGFRWRFAVHQRQLTRREEPPLARWDAAYDFPEDTETICSVTVQDCLIDFDRYADALLCNAQATDTVIAECIIIPPVEQWPGWFQSLMQVKLASEFAMPITEDPAKAQLYEQRFIKDFTQARLIDAQGATAKKMPVGRYRRIHGGTP